MQESQTKRVLGTMMHDIHQEFGLTEKVVATTTDNGSNYRAAFEMFGSSTEPMPIIERPVDSDEDDAEEQLIEDSELVPSSESRCLDLHGILRDASEEEDSLDIQLPPQRRCWYCV